MRAACQHGAPGAHPAAHDFLDSRSVDDPVAVSQRWWDEISRDGNIDAIDDLFTEPLTRHTGSGSETVTRSAYKGRLAEAQRILSRVQTTIDDRVVDGEKVWTRATSSGINRETGERSIVTWLLVQRVVDGRIAEQWVSTFPGVDWSARGR